MIDFGDYDVMLEMDESENDLQVHLRVARFSCVPGSDPAHGYHVELTRTYAGEPSEMFESGFFREDDVSDLPLYAGEDINERIRAAILEPCFGIVAYAWYQIQVAGADLPCPVLMSIARQGAGYVLRLGADVGVEFRTVEELQAIMPPFDAKQERNYEAARAKLLDRFGRR